MIQPQTNEPFVDKDPSAGYPPTRPTLPLLAVALVAVLGVLAVIDWSQVSAFAHSAEARLGF